jgi:hypothetical protein
MRLSPQEQSVVNAVAARRDGLVALASELVALDTVAHMAGAPPREERALWEHVAALLRSQCSRECKTATSTGPTASLSLK